MWTNTTYGLNRHDNLQLLYFWILQAVTTGDNLQYFFDKWVGVPSPPKKFKKFTIKVGEYKYSNKKFHSEEYLWQWEIDVLATNIGS